MDHAVDRARDLFDQLDAAAAATPTGEPVPRSSVDAIIDAGVHAVSVPREVGGLELPLSEAIDVWAELSRADGSTGWCAFAADITAAYFGAYLPDDGAATVFADGVPVMAGQFAPNGTAAIDGTDLVVDGDYQFGSGIAHASWVGAGVLAGPDAAEYLFTCFPADQAELRGNWDVLGLQATASYDYGVRDVRVPRSHSFDFFAPKVHRGGPMYTLGVLPITAAGHSGWALGVTRRALDELAALATDTTRMGASSSLADSERFLHEYGNLESRYLAGRAWIHELLVGAEAQADARRRHRRHHRQPAPAGVRAHQPRRRRHRPRGLPARGHPGAARRAAPAGVPRPPRRQPALLRQPRVDDRPGTVPAGDLTAGRAPRDRSPRGATHARRMGRMRREQG